MSITTIITAIKKPLDQHNLTGRSSNICRSHIGPLPRLLIAISVLQRDE